jgi:hypothetical protein
LRLRAVCMRRRTRTKAAHRERKRGPIETLCCEKARQCRHGNREGWVEWVAGARNLAPQLAGAPMAVHVVRHAMRASSGAAPREGHTRKPWFAHAVSVTGSCRILAWIWQNRKCMRTRAQQRSKAAEPQQHAAARPSAGLIRGSSRLLAGGPKAGRKRERRSPKDRRPANSGAENKPGGHPAYQ